MLKKLSPISDGLIDNLDLLQTFYQSLNSLEQTNENYSKGCKANFGP